MRQSITLGAVALGSFLLSCLPTADAKCSSSLDDPEIKWDSSKKRLVLTKGCATMSDLVNRMPIKDKYGNDQVNVYHFSKSQNRVTSSWTGSYYLDTDLYVTNGATLSIDGDGSDMNECDTLYLQSSSSGIINLRAYGGKLDIRNTRIFSWDIKNNDYHTKPGSKGRSHISAVTEMITGRKKDTCPDSYNAAQKDMGRATMDIYRSEIAYLGYQQSEAYGISYKARGLCKDHSNLDIYDDDNGLDYHTKGDIIESDLHHNWFGHYSWGHNGGEWKYNKVHDNERYGFDPHDDSDNLKILNNEVYNNGWHGIIASKRCNNVKIQNNKVYNNGKAGIMLHRSSNYGTVSNNEVYNNGDAGMALFESSHNKIYDNTFTNNRQGIRWSNGANNNKVYGNTITIGSASLYAFYSYKGSDPQEADGNTDGYNKNNQVYQNNIHSSKNHVWELRDVEDNVFKSNKIHSGKYGRFRYSENNDVKYNDFPDDWYFSNYQSCFATGGQTSPDC